jgi:drug/metabolite transporter (DMT)-like permease
MLGMAALAGKTDSDHGGAPAPLMCVYMMIPLCANASLRRCSSIADMLYKMTRLRADTLLLLCALIWGTAFIAQKYANLAMGPLWFVAARFFLSALLLVPLSLREAAREGGAAPAGRGDLLLAGLIGLCVCAAASMQQTALISTSATNGGFLTAVYVAFVPFVVWLVARTPPRPMVLAAVAVTIAGSWLLADRGQARTWSRGDLILLVSDLVWALHITLVAKFLGRLNRPFLLCFIQYAVTALGAAALALFTETLTLQGVRAALPAILYAGIASGGIAYTLQIVAQRHTPVAEAALIMSLESVFAALAGAVLLGERLTPLAAGGCVMILGGVVMVEVAPALRRGFLRLTRTDQFPTSPPPAGD